MCLLAGFVTGFGYGIMKSESIASPVVASDLYLKGMLILNFGMILMVVNAFIIRRHRKQNSGQESGKSKGSEL